jgi:hypothetical protein
MYRNLNNRVEAACPVLGRMRAAVGDPADDGAGQAARGTCGRTVVCAADAAADPPGPPGTPEAVGTFDYLMRATSAGWGS